MLPGYRCNIGLWFCQNTTLLREVGSDDEQVRGRAFGVGTGELDLLTKVVALVAGCHDSDCALFDLYINLVALEVTKCIGWSVVCFNTDGVLLCLGVVGSD